MFHIPYHSHSSPFDVKLSTCQVCKKRNVPEIVLSTIDIPPLLQTCGHPRLIEARIMRPFKKRKTSQEGFAKQLSEILPFVEYDLHRQLLHKLNLHCMNACFNLVYNVTISETKIVATLTGTGILARALPTPEKLTFHRSLKVSTDEDHIMVKLQKQLKRMSELNHKNATIMLKEIVEEDTTDSDDENVQVATPSSLDAPPMQTNLPVSFSPSNNSELDSDDIRVKVDEQVVKTGYVVEIDDDTDEDNMAALLDPLLPKGIYICNVQSLQTIPGLPKVASHLQELIIQKRYILNAPVERSNQQISAVFNDILAQVAYKLQLYTPCVVSGIQTNCKMVADNDLFITWQASVMLLDADEKNDDNDDKELQMDPLPTLLPDTLHPLHALMQEYKKKQEEEEQLHASPKNNANQQSTNVSASTNTDFKAVHLKTESNLLNMESNNVDDGASTDDDGTSTEDDFDDDDHSFRRGHLLPLEADDLVEYMQERFVVMTPMSYVPGALTKRIIGRLAQHFVRETDDYTHEGYGNFLTNAILEVNAVVRANVLAIGANALFNHNVTFHVNHDNPYKRQAYCLITVSGDVAEVMHDEKSGAASTQGLEMQTFLNCTKKGV